MVTIALPAPVTVPLPVPVAARDEPPVVLRLPRCCAGRRRVHRLLARQGIPGDLTGRRLVVLCRRALFVTESFADELVRVAIPERHASELALVRSGRRILTTFKFVRLRQQVEEPVRLRRAADVGV